MLVLSRKSGERILIGSNIEISVVRVQGGRVEIGIKAPRSVPVHREEIADRCLQLPDASSRESSPGVLDISAQEMASLEMTAAVA